jgi:hypothetical protein
MIYTKIIVLLLHCSVYICDMQSYHREGKMSRMANHRFSLSLTGGVLLALSRLAFCIAPTNVFASSQHVHIHHGDYSSSCNAITINKSGILSANCENVNHQSAFSTLNLNDHIGNNNGHLVWA